MSAEHRKELGLISLFCGPGGMDEGFRQAGFKSLLAYDKDVAGIETYNHNHGKEIAKQADLSTFSVAQIIEDWKRQSNSRPIGIVGGPPCQSFSVGNATQTPDDKRNLLPSHYARILNELNAYFGLDFFVFENVPGLLGKRHKAVFEQFIQKSGDAGFHIDYGWLNAKDFNVAQRRRRIFVVGLNKEKYPQQNFMFPDSNCNEVRTVRDAIGDLPEPTFFRRGLTAAEISHHCNHWCMVPRSVKFYDGTLSAGRNKGKSFRVLDWDKASYTVAYGNNEVHIHPNCQRRLSVYEAMLLQGFPDDYVMKGSLTDQIRLVSEAVPPPISRAIGVALRQQLHL